MSYHVRLEQFEGPLELLLSLIEKEKLDITKVSLSRVADQYLEYLERDQSIALSNLSQFLSIATRLILLKSRALLPLLTFTEEEEQSLDDLERQLREYQKFREKARELGVAFERKNQAFVREPFHGVKISFSPPKNLVPADLEKAFVATLGEIPIVQKLEEEALAQVVTLEEKMAELQVSLRERLRTSFREVTANVNTRVELIVSFLALLELVKQRVISAQQHEYFGDIHIESFNFKKI